MKREAKEAFLKLLKPIYPRLSQYALAITSNTEEAEDLVSDTVLIALEQFEKIKDEKHFTGFLFKVASRLHKRRRYRNRFRVGYDREAAESQEDSAPKPDHAAEIAIVMSALEKLPEKIKETVVLFDVTDLSLEEIRAIQGGTLSGVKSRLNRGRKMLQKNLGISDNREELHFRTMDTKNLKPALTKTGEYYAL